MKHPVDPGRRLQGRTATFEKDRTRPMTALVHVSIREGIDLLPILDHCGDLAVPHLDDLVHKLAHAQVVGHHDPSQVLSMDLIGKCLHHLQRPLRIKAGRWFISEHDARPMH